MWNKTVERILLNSGYKKSMYEPCIFVKCNDDFIMLIALYVDDFLIFYNNDNERGKIVKILSDNFKVRDMGSVNRCLGLNINISKEKTEISVHQKHYILEL